MDYKRKKTYVGKLDHTKLSEIGEAVMSCIFVDNQRDVLHRFGTEPARHDCKVFPVENVSSQGSSTINSESKTSLLLAAAVATDATAAAADERQIRSKFQEMVRSSCTYKSTWAIKTVIIML
jgi:hypothetical protein